MKMSDEQLICEHHEQQRYWLLISDFLRSAQKFQCLVRVQEHMANKVHET